MNDSPTSTGRECGAIRIPLDAEQRAHWQARLNTLPVLTQMGAQLDLSDETTVRIGLVKSLPSHSGGLGGDAINGATLAALVDCGIATIGVLLFRGRTCGTLQLSIEFMKPVRTSLPQLECRVVRRTSTLAFVEARLVGSRGALHLKASGIVSVAKALAGDDESWRSRFANEVEPNALVPPAHLDPSIHHDPVAQAV